MICPVLFKRKEDYKWSPALAANLHFHQVSSVVTDKLFGRLLLLFICFALCDISVWRTPKYHHMTLKTAIFEVIKFHLRRSSQLETELGSNLLVMMCLMATIELPDT
jgi:hypothetical protein